MDLVSLFLLPLFFLLPSPSPLTSLFNVIELSIKPLSRLHISDPTLLGQTIKGSLTHLDWLEDIELPSFISSNASNDGSPLTGGAGGGGGGAGEEGSESSCDLHLLAVLASRMCFFFFFFG